MKASLEVELEDRPGQLRKLLAVLEEVNANVVSVTHTHGRKEGSHVPVEIMFSVQGKEALDRMGSMLREGGWHIISLEKVAQLRRVTVGIIGHIINTKSVEPIIDKVDSLGANVSRFSVNMPCQAGESSALITFEAEDDAVVEKAIGEIERLCAERGFLLIKTVL